MKSKNKTKTKQQPPNQKITHKLIDTDNRLKADGGGGGKMVGKMAEGSQGTNFQLV